MPTARTRLVARHAGHRDARLFIVATEGARTEPQYIDALKFNGVIDRTRIIVEVVPTLDGRSSPAHVLARLKEARSQRELKSFDEFWLLLDVDRWEERMLSLVAQEAFQSGYSLGVSNPCFEVWVALHSADTLPALVTCAEVEALLRQLWGAYQKANLPVERFSREAVEAAIERAKRLDRDPSARWPQASPVTHAHRLFDRLLGRT
ncbi:RloB family protein [Archangium sp.]|uniref:RloB family protein n=1 Tax=Archangium sp. TaxID=1872627 RepID=UPI00389B2B1D